MKTDPCGSHTLQANTLPFADLSSKFDIFKNTPSPHKKDLATTWVDDIHTGIQNQFGFKWLRCVSQLLTFSTINTR